MMKSVALLAFGAVGALADSSAQMAAMGLSEGDSAVSLNLPHTPEVEAAFERVYDSYLRDFDTDGYHKLLATMEQGMTNYKESAAFNGYKTIPGQPMCDRGVVTPSMKRALGAKAVSAFPGGVLKRIFGFDMGKFIFELSQKAAGPAAASGGMAGILAMQALAMGAGMLQSGVAGAVHILPKIIPVLPKPALTCVPMVTGHNCFGAILTPITMADFVIADVTDSMMDGYIAGFPNTYATKVGKTSDAMYKACFSAYMSMMCSSIFPRCTAPTSTDEPVPNVGRVPMCFTMCLATLVMCPGFWIEDVLGPCQMVSAPPACSFATFWNIWRLPPQYVSFEESHPKPLSCPKTDISLEGGAVSADSDYGLYDAGRENAGASPFTLAAAGETGGATATTSSVKLPNA